MLLLRLCLVVSCLVVSSARAQEVVDPPSSAFVHVPKGERQPVRFTLDEASDRLNLTLYVQREVNPVLGPGGSAETGAYQPLCPVPCELQMRPGPYVLGVAAGAGATVKVGETLRLHGGERIALGYDDRQLLRIAGWFTLFGGAGGGALLIVHGSGHDRPLEIAAGTILGAAAIGIGLWLANLPDRGYVVRLP